MPWFDPKKPPKQELTTTGGVQVVVRDVEPEQRGFPEWPEEVAEPEPPADPFPTAIIFPAGQSLADRAAFMASLDEQWGDFIAMKLRRGDISLESQKDLRQEAIIVLFNARDKLNGSRRQVTKFVDTVVTHLICNRGRHAELGVLRGVEMDAQVASAPSPESATRRAELWRQLMGFVDRLEPHEKVVWRARELDEMTFAAIAEMLDQAETTVSRWHAGAKEKLEAMARLAELAPALRAHPPRQSTGVRK